MPPIPGTEDPYVDPRVSHEPRPEPPYDPQGGNPLGGAASVDIIVPPEKAINTTTVPMQSYGGKFNLEMEVEASKNMPFWPNMMKNPED